MSNILRQRLEARQSVHTEHPGTDLLAAFIEHRLKDSEREKLLGHLATCSVCRDAIILAIPEAAAETAGTAAARGFSVHFPAAMRWASVAAALAVAVGVGVLSYEHQPVLRNTPTTPLPSAPQQKPVIAQSEQSTALQDHLSAPSERQKTTEHRKSAPPNTRGANGLLAVDRTENTRGSSAVKLETSNRAFAANLREQQPSAAPSQNQPQLQSTDGYLNAAAAKEDGPTSRNETFAAKSVAAPAAVSAPQSVDQGAPIVGGNTDVVAENKPSPSSGKQTVEVAGVAGSLHGEALSMPQKAIRFSELGGPMMKKSGAAFTEMVSWTVTAAGKLQRQLRNGAVKFIEPAPGVMVRAVAARGIEVWAAGSQPDLSARQWRQVPALFHSSDAGETWTRVNGPWHSSINALTLTSPSSLTVATEDGTWISRDAGKSWTTE